MTLDNYIIAFCYFQCTDTSQNDLLYTSGKSKNFLPTLRALDVLRDSLSEVRRSFFLKICLENIAVSKIKKMQMIQAMTKGGGGGGIKLWLRDLDLR